MNYIEAYTPLVVMILFIAILLYLLRDKFSYARDNVLQSSNIDLKKKDNLIKCKDCGHYL